MNKQPIPGKAIPHVLNPNIKGVTNITPEQAMKIDSNSITKGEVDKPNDNVNNINNNLLKPKKSKWEPEPVLFRLPSYGKSIPKHLHKYLTDKKEIFIRRITAPEENILSKLRNNNSESMLKIITEVLEACVKTNIDIKYFMLLDKIPMFLFLIDISYKHENELVNIRCPECYQIHKININLQNDLKIRYIDDSVEYPLSFKTNKSYSNQYTIEFEAPTFEHESLFENEDLEVSKLLFNLVLDIRDENDNKVPKEDWMNLINNLDFNDRIIFRNKLNKFVSDYGTDAKMDFICENKGCTKYNQKVRIDIPLDQIFINLINSKTL